MPGSSEDKSVSAPESADLSVGMPFLCPTCGPNGRVKSIGHCNSTKGGPSTTIRCGTCNRRTKTSSGVFEVVTLTSAS